MYQYYPRGRRAEDSERSRESAIEFGRKRANPSDADPDKVIVLERQRLLKERISRVTGKGLRVLDIGGRIQPYRYLLNGREEIYIAIDRQLDGLVDVIATGESLPFPDGYFDLIICTQVLTYIPDPYRLVKEARRVLKPGGAMFLSTPSFFPEHHDELWRFLPGGLRQLLDEWDEVEVLPEGNSYVGALRILADKISQSKGTVRSALARKLIVPVINWISLKLLDRSTKLDLVANYSTWAVK